MTLQDIQSEFRRLLKVNDFKENTKRSLDMEFGFLQGVLSVCRLNKEIAPPMIDICIFTGRSILTVDPYQFSE